MPRHQQGAGKHVRTCSSREKAGLPTSNMKFYNAFKYQHTINEDSKEFSRDSSVGRAVDCSGKLSSIGHWFDSGSRDDLLLPLCNQQLVLSRDSSVGRAVDCSGLLSSIGHWFDSGSRDGLVLLYLISS
jgi:hypothetical protein